MRDRRRENSKHASRATINGWRFSATARPFIGQFMVTWHLTTKLFPAKCHERAKLRKLWRQTGNSSLLPAKCSPLLHVIAGISGRFSNFTFVLFCYITNHLMTGPSVNSEYCFPGISVFPSILSRETLRFSGKKIHCSPWDQSLSVNYYSDFYISLPSSLSFRARSNSLPASTSWYLVVHSSLPRGWAAGCSAKD